MATRRQEKVARVVKEVVSDAIANRLNDPRIDGFVSVTRVDMSPNIKEGDVYLSIFGKNESDQNKVFAAISHAKSRIQSLLAGRMTSKFCPVLRFHKDENFKKTLEILRLIEKTSEQLDEKATQ